MKSWCFDILVMSIGKEEEMRNELFAALGSLDHEIAEKDRHKYSLDDLLKLMDDVRKGKGMKRGK